MTGRQDHLGSVLSEVLREEGEAIEVDMLPATERLQRELSDSRRPGRGPVIVIVAALAAAVTVFALSPDHSSTEDQPTSPPSVRPAPSPDVSQVPFLLDVTTGATSPLPDNLVPESVGEDTGHDDFRYGVSPDGTRLTYACHGGDSDCESRDAIVVANLDGTALRTLRLPREPATTGSLAWSPDGTKLAYATHMHGAPLSGGVFVQDVASGRRTELVNFLDAFALDIVDTTAVFSADGQSVLFQAPGGDDGAEPDLWTVPVEGGEPARLLSDAAVAMPFPNGEGLAFLQPDGGGTSGASIQVDDGHGSRRTLVEAVESIVWPAMSPDGSRITYQDAGFVWVVDVSTGESSRLIRGSYSAAWLGDDKVLLAPGCIDPPLRC